MTLLQALEFSKALAKHNPFVRMTDEEQKLANIASDRTLRARSAGPMLSKAANTEEFEDLLKNER